MTIAQTDLVAGILRLLAKLGVVDAEARIVNVCIDAADAILREIQREPVRASDGMGLAAWLASDDTGSSSRFMAHILAGGPAVSVEMGAAPHPHDPSDFGRCYRFLRAVPEARPALGRLAAHGPVWAAYIARWDEMERLWLEESPTGKATRLYVLMRQIQDKATQP